MRTTIAVIAAAAGIVSAAPKAQYGYGSYPESVVTITSGITVTSTICKTNIIS